MDGLIMTAKRNMNYEVYYAKIFQVKTVLEI